MKKTAVIAGVVLVLIALVVSVVVDIAASNGARRQTSAPASSAKAFPDSIYRHETLVIGGKAFDALVSDTPALRETGLSYRDSLAPGQAMLFVFDKPDLVGFWMKDMRFSLDMLWLDASSAVVSFEQDVSPDTYPKAFFPSKPSLYVVELPAGTLAALGVKPGDEVVMSGGK